MRRAELVAAVQNVRSALRESGLAELTERLIQSRRPEKAAEAQGAVRNYFEAFQKYTILQSRFGDIENKVLAILGLSNLSSAKFWEDLVSEGAPVAYDLRRNILLAEHYLPKIIELLQQHQFTETQLAREDLPSEFRGKSLLTLVLPEDAGQASSPKRLITAMDAIVKIYDVFAQIDGLEGNTLIVLACDSGSDKSFDFLGVAKLISEVRQFILAIYDRIVFGRHLHAGQTLDTISKSLPIIQKIGEMKENGVLSAEAAEIMSRKAMAAATGLVEVGAVIPEMDAVSNISPRSLMRPEPKMLAAPSSLSRSHGDGEPQNSTALNAEGSQGAPAGDTAELSQEDIKELRELLRKSERDKKAVGPRKRKGSKQA